MPQDHMVEEMIPKEKKDLFIVVIILLSVMVSSRLQVSDLYLASCFYIAMSVVGEIWSGDVVLSNNIW